MILQHSVPPRLARSTDRTEDTAVLRLAGAHAVAVMGAAGLPVPNVANRVMEGSTHGATLEVARTSDVAPFLFQVTTATDHIESIRARMVEIGRASCRERGEVEVG